MKRSIRNAAVLGAGTMGSRIAAHLANAGVSCCLLDVVPTELSPREARKGLALESPQVRSRPARQGVEAGLKSRPGAFFVPDVARRIRVGNFEDHLHWVKDCDWVIEAVAENREIKRSLLSRVAPLRTPGTIISSNTSGLSLTSLAEGMDDDFRRHWLGTHFFNPPRFMRLLELIPTPDTLPDVVEALSDFGDRVLGKGVVVAKDTPNFIANRIGAFVTGNILRVMAEEGYSIEEIDALTGPAMGLPKSATFRTLDLVGLDLALQVGRNLYEAVPSDERREAFRFPSFVEDMLQRKLLGDKTGSGFYKKVKSAQGSEILTLDLESFEYRPRRKPKLPSLEMARNVENTPQRVSTLFHSRDRTGEFYRRMLGDVFHYAASRIPEISDDVVSVDRAMRWGYGWECGVFELFDAVGVEKVADQWEKQSQPVPHLVERLLKSGKKAFYRRSGGQTSYFDLGGGQYQALEERPGVVFLSSLHAAGKRIQKNAGASLVDLGDGVLCLEFHSKMNTLGADTMEMIQAGMKRLSEDFDALVIGNEAANFSAGANLMLVLLAIQEEEWEEIDEMVRAFQGAAMSLKYAAKPVVSAPFGLTLGGGVEIALHSARVRAAAESYMGLVETGVGLIPAGGGAKEMLLRAIETLPATIDSDPLVNITKVFETIGMGKISTSAEDARRLGFLRDHDSISPNPDRLIADAKQEALALVRGGYQPPRPPEDIPVFGEPVFSALKLGLYLMRRAEFITEYDVVVGTKLAGVLSGGPLSGKQAVNEQYLLDLEREAFLSLCGEPRTEARIQHMLKTGKSLRN